MHTKQAVKQEAGAKNDATRTTIPKSSAMAIKYAIDNSPVSRHVPHLSYFLRFSNILVMPNLIRPMEYSKFAVCLTLQAMMANEPELDSTMVREVIGGLLYDQILGSDDLARCPEKESPGQRARREAIVEDFSRILEASLDEVGSYKRCHKVNTLTLIFFAVWTREIRHKLSSQSQLAVSVEGENTTSAVQPSRKCGRPEKNADVLPVPLADQCLAMLQLRIVLGPKQLETWRGW